ncbi:NUDIX domain-containing protein [Agromyces sp. ISL-38]|uniref:NUDIX domain-containing protein n=1 Tax=Agromyces sp. ISL-38 TaxID=2819107 RepID=UPI001BE68255|nr:NUDIX domain-containing protein [Agromyces sp. ISL-38]MBT2499108.1 NUDIX domain-containing protein [Agromyces sp. ISL-38]MBT2518350.1 NUDIX domain-containing protein [Streptomyces sp. ISL-90]
MPVTSAGLLLYRAGEELEVFIAHMGGPFWARKREGAWSIPKGEHDAGEDPLAAARREFAEEIGAPAPEIDYADLGSFRYSSGKLIRVFAGAAADFTVDEVRSNTFEVEWPPRSGRRQSFPEVDEAAWITVTEARSLLVVGQRPALDALERLVAPAAE